MFIPVLGTNALLFFTFHYLFGYQLSILTIFIYLFIYLPSLDKINRMCVPKDLANRWTDMVLLYNVASQGPGKVLSLF